VIIEGNIYYVYIHRDPISQQDLYVGLGKAERAYSFNSRSYQKYGSRHSDHSDYLWGLIDQGYLPHEWIIFDSKNLSMKDALIRERELIQEYKPKFNRKGIHRKSVTTQQVKEIKTLRAKGMKYRDLASKFDCSTTTINRVLTGQRGTY